MGILPMKTPMTRLAPVTCCMAFALLQSASAAINWNPGTLQLIEPGGCYGRMAALQDNATLAFVCEQRKGTPHPSIWFRESRDNGQTWSPACEIASWTQGALANPELLLLRDGSLLCFYNQRPVKHSGARHAIAVTRREKGAATWSPPHTLYQAGKERNDGCWEPAAIELPSGEIQLFFANENPYRASDEQEVTLMRSHDSGRSFSPPERIGFRAGFRDGMPVPLALNNNAGITVAIEDNGLDNTAFKPAILFTRLDDSWCSGTRIPGHPDRWGALAIPLSAATYAGAPYLRQFANNTTILSFQMSTSGEMRHSRAAVCLGDAQAQNFGTPSFPFPETPKHPQLWASLCVTGKKTIKALVTATFNNTNGIWSIDGTLTCD